MRKINRKEIWENRKGNMKLNRKKNMKIMLMKIKLPSSPMPWLDVFCIAEAAITKTFY
jgi:hypothetical protein